MTLGDIVKQYRTEHKMSMDDFSHFCGLSKGYISMLEKNMNPSTKKPIAPSLETIKQIAGAMNIDVDSLLKQLDSEHEISLKSKSPIPLNFIPGERLKEALLIRNMKQSDLVEASGVDKGALSSYIHGRYKPKQDNIHLLAKALDVNEAWLMGYDVPMERTTKDNILLPKNAIPIGEQGKLPIIGKVSAGMGVLAYDDILGYEFADVRYCDENHFYLRVSGDSMMPKIEDGDLVLVHKQDSVDSGNYAVVIVDDEDGCVKIVKYGKNWIELHSINPYYPIREFKNSDVLRIRVIGKVIEIKRKL